MRLVASQLLNAVIEHQIPAGTPICAYRITPCEFQRERIDRQLDFVPEIGFEHFISTINLSGIQPEATDLYAMSIARCAIPRIHRVVTVMLSQKTYHCITTTQIYLFFKKHDSLLRKKPTWFRECWLSTYPKKSPGSI